MKKNIKKIFLMITVLSIVFLISNVFATNLSAIATVSSETVSPNENFYLILNLSAISYNKFQVDITNNQGLTSTETTGTVQGLSSNSVVTTLVIDKSQIGLEKLGIVYTAPNTEGSVNFEVKITSLQDDKLELTNQISTLTIEIEVLQNTYTELTNSLELEEDKTSETYQEAVNTITELKNTIDSKISEKEELENILSNYETPTLLATTSIQVKKDTSKPQNMVNNDLIMNENKLPDNIKDMNKIPNEMKEMEDKMKRMENMSDEMKTKMGSLEFSLKTAEDTISSLSKDTTYQGSSNNYLSVLSVNGYEFSNGFDKTTNDYFITVDNSVSSLKVTATPEDSTATVTVYGNASIETGKNKIIINVTAEDSSVRTYRIYVTKQ